MGGKTTLTIPLLRDGTAIGAISLNAREPGGFSDSQVSLLQTFAEQAVIAIGSAETYRALQERTTALAQRNSAYSEQVAHQAATIDVLKVMSASPSDAQPVFDLVSRLACEICGAQTAAFFSLENGLVHFRANFFAEEFMPPDALEAFRRRYPMPPNSSSFSGRALLTRQIVHIRDIAAEPDVHSTVRALGHRSNLAIPLLHDGSAIGVISLSGAMSGGFSDAQVELARTFAEQATIAITTAETYRELQERTEALAQRNSEYGERIQQQAATIDVLKVMSAAAATNSRCWS